MLARTVERLSAAAATRHRVGARRDKQLTAVFASPLVVVNAACELLVCELGEMTAGLAASGGETPLPLPQFAAAALALVLLGEVVGETLARTVETDDDLLVHPAPGQLPDVFFRHAGNHHRGIGRDPVEALAADVTSLDGAQDGVPPLIVGEVGVTHACTPTLC